MAIQARSLSLFDPSILGPAVGDAFRKLDPRTLWRNPVMFVVEIVSAATTILFVRDLVVGSGAGFSGQISLWLWFTVLFANFAEAVAEGRGKAQAATLRRTQSQAVAKRLQAANATNWQEVPAAQLKVGDLVLVEAGDLIPSDGEIVEGIASVDESAITGESAPVIRESGGDRSAVTGGTRVLSDQIKVRITASQGSTFLDRMIRLVEGAERQKTPERDRAPQTLSGHSDGVSQRANCLPEATFAAAEELTGLGGNRKFDGADRRRESTLFDHLVGTGEHRLRHRERERLRGLRNK